MPLLVSPAIPSGAMRSLPQPVLGTSLVLRPWEIADASVVLKAFSCPDIQRWHVRTMADTDESLAWILGWPLRWDAETDASWAITSSGRVLGQIGLRTISLFEASAQLSYWVLPSARGAGIAWRAARLLSQWCFDTLLLNRLFLLHSTANLASCRVAERASFALEGTQRKSLQHADGWHDVHVHARLRSDE